MLVEDQPAEVTSTAVAAAAAADFAIWSCLPQSLPAMPIQLGQAGQADLETEVMADLRHLPGRSRLEEEEAD